MKVKTNLLVKGEDQIGKEQFICLKLNHRYISIYFDMNGDVNIFTHQNIDKMILEIEEIIGWKSWMLSGIKDQHINKSIKFNLKN